MLAKYFKDLNLIFENFLMSPLLGNLLKQFLKVIKILSKSKFPTNGSWLLRLS